ncbi:MAG: C13 family peptidase [Chloroflexota bacterium]
MLQDDNKPTAVELLSFTATNTPSGVDIRWVTGAEINTFGFFLYRNTSRDRENAIRITPSLIDSKDPLGGEYQFLDNLDISDNTYVYWLMEVENDSTQIDYGPIQITIPPTPSPTPTAALTSLKGTPVPFLYPDPNDDALPEGNAEAAIMLTIQGNGDPVPAQEFEYIISYQNNVNFIIENLIITVRVPENTSFISGQPDSWVCQNSGEAGDLCSYNAGTLTVGQNSQRSFMVDVASDISVGDTLVFNIRADADGGTPSNNLAVGAGSNITMSPGFLPEPTIPTHTPTLTPAPPTSTPAPTATDTPIHTPTATFTPSPTSSLTLIPEDDDDDNNNTCERARLIQPNGLAQIHTFHTIGDTDWSTFIAPTPGVYRIEITIPNGSPADVDLYYYTECNAFHRSQFVGTHTPGARLDVTIGEDEVGKPYYIKINHFDPLQFGPNVIYNLSVRPLPPERDEEGDLIIPGPAIIVAGRYRYGDTVQDNIDQTALAAYNLFNVKGRNHSEIFFLATNSTLPHVDGTATLRNLEIGIKDEARKHLQKENVSQVLSLYLVDHGGPNEFYLDRPNEEILTPDHLHDWLTDLEEEFPDLLVNVFIEACNAGSFITPNGGSISKENRVIITSSDEAYDAYTSLRGTLFSDNFLSFLGQEHNLAYSFETSMRIVQEHHGSQEPWIDANGNGLPNELEDMSKASLRSFANTSLGSEWPPYIADVQLLVRSRSNVTRFQAEVRHEFDNSAIDGVWAVVYPPSYALPTNESSIDSDGVLNTDTLDMIEFNTESEDANALFAGTYAGFTEMGVHRVVVYALDNKGLHAQPVTVEIDTTHRIFLPMVSR